MTANIRTRLFHERGHIIEVSDVGLNEWRATIDGTEVRGVWTNSWDAYLELRRKVRRLDRRTAR